MSTMIFPSVQVTNTGIQMHTFSNCVNGAIEQQTFAQSFIQVYYLASNTSCVYLYLYLCICICLAAATSSIGSTCLGHKFFPLCSFERSSLTIHPIPLSNILHIDKLNKSTFKTCMYWFPSQMAREMLWSPK